MYGMKAERLDAFTNNSVIEEFDEVVWRHERGRVVPKVRFSVETVSAKLPCRTSST